MITRRRGAGQPAGWQQELAAAIRDPAELLACLGLDPDLLPAARRAASRFPLLVPRGFVERMRPNDPADPLLRQVLPLAEELEERDGFVADPVGDSDAARAPGVLCKYEGRALLIASGTCAINCRYCFRREYPYGDNNASADEWRAALAAIRSDTSRGEIILSGGDPLALGDRRLASFSSALRQVPWLRRLRIHSRVPIVLPSRIDDDFLAWIGRVDLPVVLVLHANHAREIDGSVRTATEALRRAGITLLNQSVLLRGVNDDQDSICELSEALFSAGVLPYYLHQLDPVRGAGHFGVEDERAATILRRAAERLPGYLLPRLVREIPGAPAKRPVIGDRDSAGQEAEALSCLP